MFDSKFHKILNLYKDKHILFWGASLFLKDFIQKNDLSEFKILGIIDRNKKKIGSEFMGYRVFSPLEIVNFENVYIISTVKNSSDTVYQRIADFLEFANLQQQVTLVENPFLNRLEKLASNHIYLINDKNEKYEVSYIEGLNVIWLGENSTITFYTNDIPQIINTTIRINSNSQITIGFNSDIRNLLVRMEMKNLMISIGNNFRIYQGEFVITGSRGVKIQIGNDCLFSSHICLRADDGHTIYDNKTNKILNHSKRIVIGNHVWLGNGVHILKNAVIPDNTIVGTKSIVNKPFEDTNTVIAGIPAKIVKKNINWDRRGLANFIGEYYEE